jgi:ABC-2 type transport system ATP-binding protein
MINVRQVDFAYPRKENLFSQLNLQLEQGKIYGLLGKNGTGKSSLMRLLAGMHRPTSGSILYDEEPIYKRSVCLLQDIFFLPENPFLPSLSVQAYFSLYKRFYKSLDREAFYKNLTYLEIDIKRKLSNLSQGQKKKFLLALGLASGAAYLYLDEPTSHLDIPSKQKFRKLIAGSLVPTQSVLISTHQVDEISSLLDRIIIISNGSISLDADIGKIEKALTCISSLDEFCEGALYSELKLGKYIHLKKNTENIQREIPLTLLFNAVTENENIVDSILKK